jgi:hypothetical protein
MLVTSTAHLSQLGLRSIQYNHRGKYKAVDNLPLQISIRKVRTNNHLACPFHQQSDDYREESESTQRYSIDCQEP